MSDLREAIRESIGELSAEAEAPAVSESAPVSAEAVDVGGSDAVLSGPVTPGTSETTPTEAPTPGRQRDASGKFVKGEEASTAPVKGAKKQPKPTPTPITTNGVPSQTPQPQPGVPTQTPAPKFKAPASWSPAARERWASLHEEAQAEVDKREREITKALQEAAKPREFYSQFQQTIAPYEGLIRAEGGDPLRAVGSLLQTAVALRTAPPAHKAQLVASIVKQFGVPIEALDQALQGVLPAQPQHGAAVDPAQIAAQVRQEIVRELSQAREANLHRQTSVEMESFGSKAEFFADVRHDAGDIMSAAARAGRAMTLEQAYNRALLVHKADPDSEIGKVLRQRDAAEAAKANTTSTQRARAAASSIRPEPVGNVSPGGGGSIRDSLRETIAEMNRTR